MSPAVLHYYKTFRTDGTEPYARTAESALASAKRHIYFRATLSASVKATAKRSKAAKKAWKARRAKHLVA